MKLFKMRVELHWTNSHSFIGGYPDIFVRAENLEEAKKKAFQYKETNKRVVKTFMEEEIKEFIN